jgi:DNA-binding transcriptional MerR regulator
MTVSYERVEATWTLRELVHAASARIAALPAPKNGQVRAVPDERTIRYYATLGLLDRPLAMRGRTALYGPRHLAQVVAIKRLQSAGHRLAEIQALWITLDDDSLAKMTGIAISAGSRTVRTQFRQGPVRAPGVPRADRPKPASSSQPEALYGVELAPGATLLVSGGRPLTIADVRAICGAAESLLAELARRGRLAQP